MSVWMVLMLTSLPSRKKRASARFPKTPALRPHESCGRHL
jgi:hypothetical protein